MDQPIIRFHGVTKHFGKNVAVDDVTIDIPRGRCYGWLGPNGSGKTTLIRMMLGLATPTSGSISVRGFTVPGDTRSALDRVGSIVEEPRFYPYLTGRANLEVWAAHYGSDSRGRIDSLLDRVGMTARADEKVKGYSLGMRQRLGVARALLNDPELLLLDEPTNGLDPAGMQEFRAMIRQMVDKEGRTVFISSHILDEVEKIADHIAIVQRGKMIANGTVAELLRGTRKAVHVRVIDIDAAKRALSDMAIVVEVVETAPSLLMVGVSDSGDADLSAIAAALVSGGAGLVEMRRTTESLEERFLELTAAGGTNP